MRQGEARRGGATVGGEEGGQKANGEGKARESLVLPAEAAERKLHLFMLEQRNDSKAPTLIPPPPPPTSPTNATTTNVASVIGPLSASWFGWRLVQIACLSVFFLPPRLDTDSNSK